MSKHVERTYPIFMIVVLVLILLTSSFLIQEAERPGDPVTYETLDFGPISGWREGDSEYEGEYIVVRNQTAWEDFWSEHRWNMSSPPNISWDYQIVLVAMHGWASTWGDKWVEFTDVRKEGRTLVAYAKRVDKGGVAGQAITNPYHIIVVERVGRVVFIEDYEPESELNWLAALILMFLVVMLIASSMWKVRVKSQDKEQPR